MKHLEKEIEDEYVLWAYTKGVLAKKFIDQGDTSAPDRICLCKGGHTFFIEFKKPGEDATVAQKIYHKELRSWGYNVYTCDNLKKAIDVTLKEINDVRNRNQHTRNIQ